MVEMFLSKRLVARWSAYEVALVLDPCVGTNFMIVLRYSGKIKSLERYF